MKIKYKSNLLSGIVSVLLGIILFSIIPMQIGTDFSVTYGITSRTLPYAISILWIICGIGLILQSLFFKREKIKEITLNKELKALGYMIVLLTYCVGFKRNFFLSTILLGWITLLFNGSRKKSYYLILFIFVLIIYSLFTKVLHIPMP